jgi:hypothetical protein
MEYENIGWVKQFFVDHGRPLKVLHIGNIANNAYNNAKLLIEAGLECDVICYDYYHVMGTPEWEDADFVVNQINQNNPEWAAINLRGFKRPKWFVQGPLDLCIEYLLEKNAGNASKELKIWNALSILNRTKPYKFSLGINATLKIYLRKINLLTILRKINLLTNYDKKTTARRVDNFLNFTSPFGLKFYIQFFYVLFTFSMFFVREILKHIISAFFGKLVVKRENFGIKEIIALIQHLSIKNIAVYQDDKNMLRQDIEKSINISLLNKWKKLFLNYDIVIGYSTDGIYPLLADTPFIAFEHGTIREIPYQDTPQGRLCAMTYGAANHIFVTNFDCRGSAEFLAPSKYSLINHPFDENHSDGIAGVDLLRKILLAELDSDFLFFFPTRHDWVEGTGYADKANNVFLNAFAQLRHLGFRVGMVCCNWGENIEDSKKILSNFNVGNYVQWSDPMATVQFERTAKACDCVVDQFKLGAFGGILFKAMAAGSPVMTYLNEEMLKDQFSEMPPVLNCRNEKDIISSIKSIYGKPESKVLLSQKSREWINGYHSKRETINTQLIQFEIMLQHKLTRSKND